MRLSYEDYTIAWICALPVERAAAVAILDDVHKSLPNNPGDCNNYTLGKIGDHNVVVACLPAGVYGTISAATVALQMPLTFGFIQLSLMVGIAGGVPSSKNDIRLGDVVVGIPSKNSGGVVQYDYGKAVRANRLEQIGTLNKPSLDLLNAVNTVRGNDSLEKSHVAFHLAKIESNHPNFRRPSPDQDADLLFQADYEHCTPESDCGTCDRERLIVRPIRTDDKPVVHYGTIGSGNQLMRDGTTRDRLAQEHNILCFEMEAAGVMDKLCCLVIRGISDYADSHKTKAWQNYAAITAAAYAKEILVVVPKKTPTAMASSIYRVRNALLMTNPEDDRILLTRTKGKRVEGTCEWFIENPVYQKWLQSPVSQILWVSGGPGKGKTMLALFLTQILEKDIPTRKHESLLYFFCDSRNNNRNTAIALLRGLLYQLLGQHPHLLSLIVDSFRGRRTIEYTVSNMVPLWRAFLTLLREGDLQSVVCILDGLDECDKDSLQQFLGHIKEYFASVVGLPLERSLKIILLSRDEPKCIKDLLGEFPRIPLNPDQDNKVKQDIERYISAKLREINSENQLSEDTQERVKKSLMEGADGTFLWVGFVTEELRGKNQWAIEMTLREIPRDLIAIYNRMLCQIRDKKKAALILSWVVLAQRPLTLTELGAAIKIEDEVQDSGARIRAHLESCGLLLKIEKNRVCLVHQSAKDFLQSDSLREREETAVFFVGKEKHLVIAKTCLECVGKAFSPSKAISKARESPLLEYAMLHWPSHLRLASNAVEDLNDISNSFFGEQSVIRELWWNSYWQQKRHGNAPAHFSLIHLAAYFGIVPILNQITSKRYSPRLRHQVDKRDKCGRTPLFWAADRGSKEIVQLLLDKGARVNATDRQKSTALHLAVAGGHRDVVFMLLDRGANPELKDNTGNTPIFVAIQIGSQETIEALLSHGASLNRLYRVTKTKQPVLYYRRENPEEVEKAAKQLLELQGPLLTAPLLRVMDLFTLSVDILAIFLKLKVVSRFLEKLAFKKMSMVEALKGEIFVTLALNGSSPMIKKQLLEAMQSQFELNGIKKMEKAVGVIIVPLFRILEQNQRLQPLGVNIIMSALHFLLDRDLREIIESVGKLTLKGSYELYRCGDFAFIQQLWKQFFTEWESFLINNMTPDATDSMAGMFNWFAIALGNDTSFLTKNIDTSVFAENILSIWVERVQELMDGELRGDALDCIRLAWSNELLYEIKRREISRMQAVIKLVSLIAEMGNEELRAAWKQIVASSIHTASLDSETAWVLEEESVNEIRLWMDDLT